MMKRIVDVTANRRARKWSRKEQVLRVVWGLTFPFFALSPRTFWGWRRFLLRLFGASIGPGAHIYQSARIMMPWNLEVGASAAVGDRAILYALGTITIGARATISQSAHLCAGTHDISDPARPLLKLPIDIGSDAWVCADAFVGPGVTIGDHAIVGARAVAMKDVPAHAVVVGNPARQIKRTDR